MSLTIKIKTINSESPIEIQVDSNWNVERLKTLLEQRTNIPIPQQRLIFQGRVLRNESPLEEYHIEDGHTIHLVSIQPSTNDSQSGGATRSTSAGTQPNATRARSTSSNPSRSHTTTRRFRTPHGEVHVSTSTIDGSSNPEAVSSILSQVLGSLSGSSQQTTDASQLLSNLFNGSSRRTQGTVSQGPINIRNVQSGIAQLQTLYQQVQENLETISNLSENPTRENVSQIDNIRHSIAPQLHSLSQAITSLQSELRITPSNTPAIIPSQNTSNVQNINVHVHANPDQLESLPSQLERFTQNIAHLRGGNRNINLSTSDASQSSSSMTVGSQPSSQQSNSFQQSVINLMSDRSQNNAQSTNQDSNDIDDMLNRVFNNSEPQSSQQLQNQLADMLVGQQTGSNANQTRDILDALQTSNRPASAVLQEFSQRIGNGSSAPSTDPINRFLGVILDQISIFDAMTIIGGQWNPLERARSGLVEYLSKEILENDLSSENRSKIVEKVVKAFYDFIRSSDASSRISDPVMSELTGILRTYIRVLVDCLLDGPESVVQRARISVQSDQQHRFSNTVHEVICVLFGEMIDTLREHCSSSRELVERIIFMLSRRFIESMPEDSQTSGIPLNNIGGNMITNFVMKEYDVYREKYPSRSRQVWRVESRNTTQQSAPRPTGRPSDMPQRPPPQNNRPSGNPLASMFGRGGNAPTQNTAAQRKEDEEKWYNGLNEDEKMEIEQTISNDLLEMMPDQTSSVTSHVYKHGVLPTRKSATEEKTQESVEDDDSEMKDEMDHELD